jgi:Protein of unknown function (DUF3489)
MTGTTDVPDFDVKSSGHAVHLTTQFRATVNGTNGEIMEATGWQAHTVRGFVSVLGSKSG